MLICFIKSHETKKSLKMTISADYINSVYNVRMSLLWKFKSILIFVIEEYGKVDLPVLQGV